MTTENPTLLDEILVDWAPLKEVMQQLNMSRGTVSRYIRDKIFDDRKLGRQKFISRESIRKYLAGVFRQGHGEDYGDAPSAKRSPKGSPPGMNPRARKRPKQAV